MVAATVLAGCGQEMASLPDACLSSPDVIRKALKAAPRPVTLQGTPISACLDQTGGADLAQSVGANLVQTATELVTQVTDAHDSASATQLGYLVGAVRKGAGEPPTLHAELLRRLELEAEGVDTKSPSYVEGEQAGEATG
jgi:hypothetical protein